MKRVWADTHWHQDQFPGVYVLRLNTPLPLLQHCYRYDLYTLDHLGIIGVTYHHISDDEIKVI